MKKHIFICIIFCTCHLPLALFAQAAIHHPNPAQNLQQRRQWAMAEAQKISQAQGYWVGYSIKRLMGEQSFIGTFHSNPRESEVVLSELLYGHKADVSQQEKSDDEQVRELAQKALDELSNRRRPETKIPKPVAILFRMPAGASSVQEIEAIKYSNLSLRFDLEGKPILWLGKAGDAESVVLLKRIYDETGGVKLRSRAVSAIGLHDSDDLVMPLLRDFALKGPAIKIRKEAIYRISQRKSTPGVAGFLLEIVFNDSNYSLQKEALYRISQFETGTSTPYLIKIAETHPVISIRKEAVYRLSQRKSSKQAVAAMENIAFEDENNSIRKEAVYRLSQVDASLGIPSLARIAKSHPDKAIRKAAIYRLGKKKHPEANKVLVELLEGK